MIRVSACLSFMLGVGGAIVVGCGSDDPAAATVADAGSDGTTAPPSTTPDGGTPGVPEAGCAHLGDEALDAGTSRTIDGGGAALVFPDVGGADRQIALSADGKTALLQDATSVGGDLYFYDTVTGTLTKKTTTGDPGFTLATALSGDGTHISAFHGKDAIVAGAWDACNGWTDTVHTGGCAGDPSSGQPNSESTGFDVNYDGSVLVGATWSGCASSSAVMWTRSGAAWTPTALQHFGIAGGSNRATVVSDDGKVIGGFSQFEGADRVPTIWHSDGTGTVLDPTGTTVGEVLAVSPDGTMVAGPWNSTSNGGFYWTQADGVVQISPLADAAGQDQMWLNAISADKRLIFGSAGDPSFFSGGLGSMQVAVVWTKAAGLRKLQDIVVGKGIALPADWYLTNVMSASADGSVLFGFATDMSGLNPVFHSFVLRLDPTAY